jgi:hypothetical protein
MESQKVRKCHGLAFMAEVRLSNIATFKKIPECAGMTTYTYCEFVIIIFMSCYCVMVRLFSTLNNNCISLRYCFEEEMEVVIT